MALVMVLNPIAATTDPAQQAEITALPLRASLRDLAGLPPAFVVGETDVSRDQGETSTRRLTEAGVPTTSVPHYSIIYDFMLLNPVRGAQAATAANTQAIGALRTALGTAEATA